MRRQRLDRWKHEREASKRRGFLEQYFIKNNKIEGIGHSRRAVLLSYGIETAWDVTRQAVDQLPGFGPALNPR